MKYLVLNITYNHKLYNYFDLIKNKIAFKENIQMYNLYNGNNLDFILQPNDFFYKNTEERIPLNEFNPANYSIQNMDELFLKFYNFIVENINLISKYDFILKCNSSTFLNFKKINDILHTLPEKNCYAGFMLNHMLVSGACTIFSKDVIFRMIETGLDNINYKTCYEDVAISNLLHDIYNIHPTNIDRYDLSNNIIPSDDEILTAINYPTIRVRNNNNREIIDVEIWKKLFDLYQRCYF